MHVNLGLRALLSHWVVSLTVVLTLFSCGRGGPPTAPVHAASPATDGDLEKPPANGRLPDDTRPLRYALTLEIVPSRTGFAGRVAIDLVLDRPRETLYLHARGLRGREVTVTPPDAEPRRGTLAQVNDSGLAAVRLRQPVGPGPVRLEIAFDAPYVEGLKGLYHVKSGGKEYAFTQFEAIAAREAFPCFDEPRFKTPFEVTLRVPAAEVAIANARERSASPIDGGLKEVHFFATEKLPTYLLAFAVGPFDVVSAPDLAVSAERDHTVPLRGIAAAGRGPDLSLALRETPAMLQSLERYFGIAYPYDKLDLIAVPDFAAGAMENAGAITFRDTYLLIKDDAPEGQRRGLASVNAHELAHQWFGNLVTMPWWDDIWLNEASATWMGERVVAELYPETQVALSALSHTHGAMDVDGQQSARQIRQPIESDHDIENAFDAITYSKGGRVLSMFERYVGAETFRQGLHLYLTRHRFGNATARDLVAALSEVAGRPLEQAFFSFLDQPGVPLVETALDCTGPAPRLSIKQSRYFPLGVGAARDQRWQVPVCVRFAVGSEPKEQCTLLSESSTQLTLDAASCPRWLMPNAGAQGYYRFTPAERDFEALLAARAELSPAEQMSLAVNADAALRSGTLPASRVLAVLSELGHTDTRQVLETSLSGFAFVREALLDPANLAAYRQKLGALVGPGYTKLGLFPKSGQAVHGESKLRRAQLVRAMAFSVKDAALRAQLYKLGRAQLGLETDPRLASLPRELIETALMVAVQEGGASLFERAEEQLFASDDGLVRTRLLMALGATEDPALGARVLSLSLDARLRTNETLLPLALQAGSFETRKGALEWLHQHRDALLARVSEHRASDAIAAFDGLCSEADAAQLDALFSPGIDRIAGGPRELRLTLEAIRSCSAVREAQRASANAYFSTPGAKPAAKPEKAH